MDDARLRRFIEDHEGRRVNAYSDSRGIPTIGVGFNLSRPDAKDKIAALGLSYDAVCRGTVSLTDAQIDALLDADIAAARAGAHGCVRGLDTLPSQAQMVIIDMVFNLGVGGFSTFRRMIAAVERQDWPAAADEMRNSLWYHQVGQRADQDIALIASCAVPPPAASRVGLTTAAQNIASDHEPSPSIVRHAGFIEGAPGRRGKKAVKSPRRRRKGQTR
jgi:GH24 family phage-related lysozyme (muramidase)